MALKRWIDDLAIGWRAILVLGALVTFLVAAQRRFSAVDALPEKVDSLTVLLRQHIDSSAKYGRLSAEYQHRTLCVLVATNARQREDCVLSDIGSP